MFHVKRSLRSLYVLEASPRPFYKKSKLSISLDQQLEFLYSFFFLYVHVDVY